MQETKIQKQLSYTQQYPEYRNAHVQNLDSEAEVCFLGPLEPVYTVFRFYILEGLPKNGKDDASIPRNYMYAELIVGIKNVLGDL